MNDSKEKKLIFLIGFMGSGKSTVGPILANTLGLDFIDLDQIVEHREGMRITEIFATKGEAAFREIERTILRTLIDEPRRVISLGGGTVTNSETLQLVKKFGVVIYLKSNTEQIFQRLRTKADRPMLRDEAGNLLEGDQLRTRITSLLDQRAPFYEQADIVIHTDDKRIGHTVDLLALQLQRMYHL